MITALYISVIGVAIILAVWLIATKEYILTFSSWNFLRAGDTFTPHGFNKQMLITRRVGYQKDRSCHLEWDYIYEVKYISRYPMLDKVIVYIKNH